MGNDKLGSSFELEQIEADILYCLPEASPWQFLRTCRLLTQATARAVLKVDPLLPTYRWFQECLWIIVRGPRADFVDDPNFIDCERVEIREALRGLVNVLIQMQGKYMSAGYFDFPPVNSIAQHLTFPMLEAYDEEPGNLDTFVEACFYRKDGCGFIYDPGPIAKIFSECYGQPIDKSLVPEEIRKVVNDHSIFFYEENDMGWFDEDFDNFISNAISKIYDERHPKNDEPVSIEDRMTAVLKNYLESHAINAVVTGFSKEGGKSLRAEMKDKGGRPVKSNGVRKALTQKDVADLFMSPCTEDIVGNWESFGKPGTDRGSLPPSVNYKGERISYSSELRKNPTEESLSILHQMADEYHAIHGVKDGIARKKIIHCKSEETLARAAGRVGAGSRNP